MVFEARSSPRKGCWEDVGRVSGGRREGVQGLSAGLSRYFLKKICKKKPDFLVDSNLFHTFAPLDKGKCCCSSVVEHFLGKEEVTSSILVNSSEEGSRRWLLFCF